MLPLILAVSVAVPHRPPLPTSSLPAQIAAPTYYSAFGDSITAGYGLADSSEAYPALVGGYQAISVANNGIVGQQACDNANNLVKLLSPALGHMQPLVSNMIGTNDANNYGTGPYQAIASMCTLSAMAWEAVPEENKVRGDAALVSGSTCVPDYTLLYFDSGPTGEICYAEGSTLLFALATSGGPLYFWPKFIDGDTGQWTYSIDGSAPVTVSTATNPPIDTLGVDGHSAYGFIRVPVEAGEHSILFTQISPGTMGIFAVGTPSDALADQLPYLLVMTVPDQLDGAKQPDVDAYRADQVADYELLLGDGLRLYLLHTEDWVCNTSLCMADQLHWNATGHAQAARAIELMIQPLQWTAQPGVLKLIPVWRRK